MNEAAAAAECFAIKEPEGLSERIARLRDYYFMGAERQWNNEYTAWTTGTPLSAASLLHASSDTTKCPSSNWRI